MTEQEIERDMYARAVALIEERYPTGWGGAAVLRAEDGRCFTAGKRQLQRAAVY